MKVRKLLCSAAVASLAVLCNFASAADYPAHSVELIVPSSAGGGTDLMARVIADVAGKYMKHGFVVINKPGASGAIGMGDVERSRPDGYKVAILISELAIIPHLGMTNFTSKDFIPIARLNGDPGTVVVKADSPWKNLKDLMAYAKKNPGTLTMGNAGAGTIWHLAAAAIEQNQGVKFNNIPYQGAAPSVTALLGGHVQAIVVSPVEVASYIKSGHLKMLGVMADKRLSGAYANVPTFKESGIDISIGTWRGLGVAKKTPPEIVNYLRKVTKEIVDDPKFATGMAHANLVISYQEGDSFRAFMAQQSDYFKKLLSTVHIEK